MLRNLLIGLFIFTVVITIIGRIRYNSPAVREERERAIKERQDYLNRFTGRAEGRIIEHHWKEYQTPKAMRQPKYKEDNMDDTEIVFMVSYEFEVDGKTYTGNGEGSPAFQVRKQQTICYDPSDPNVNCTLYYYNSQVNA